MLYSFSLFWQREFKTNTKNPYAHKYLYVFAFKYFKWLTYITKTQPKWMNNIWKPKGADSLGVCLRAYGYACSNYFIQTNNSYRKENFRIRQILKRYKSILISIIFQPFNVPAVTTDEPQNTAHRSVKAQKLFMLLIHRSTLFPCRNLRLLFVAI